MRTRWEILQPRVFGRTVLIVLGWMMLPPLLAYMMYGTVASLCDAWAGGAFHPSLYRTMPEEDFANLWAGGQLVREGRLGWLYTGDLFQAWKQVHFGPTIYEEDWIYPPTVLLLGVPLSFLPLPVGFLLWDGVTLGLAVVVLRIARLPWAVLLVGLAGPATWRSLVLGQYGVITGALVVAGLLLAPRRQGLAGVLLGLVTLKPQQGAIVAVAWLAAGYWRAIAAAACCFAVLAGIVSLWLGPAAGWLFFVHSGAMVRGILDAPPPQPNINNGVSVFWMCRTFGADIATANAAQLLAALPAVVLVFVAWRRPAMALPQVGATVCLSLLITPYGYTCDMVAYSLAVAATLADKGWRLSPVDLLLWVWPFYCTIVTVDTGRLLTPLFVVVAAARCWRQMVPRTAPATTAPVRRRSWG